MALRYDLVKKPGLKNKDPEVLIPKVVSRGTIRTEKLISQVSAGSTFQPGELKGAIQSIVDQVIYHLKEGYVVEITNLGFFSVKLKSREVTDKNEIRSQSISVANINFRASAACRSRFVSTDILRATKGFQSSVASDKEKRKALLDSYFKTHPVISRSEYSRLTGLLKNKALLDLNGWVKEGYLRKHGKKSHLVYMKTPVPVRDDRLE